ncbi:M15 family metallopeptidase [Iodobacter sp. CM08]|uniref:M15 family metallopeptidase n=1 Tax=Iodobacter sp. CM08 TaxID=3085902 RepID=UPI002981D570|nr:M15 family metallopeptidase [Iodobacter sp. CM08]MDW5418468.1 M15 family metallopeptidase [Iodobacter sp. CM08]
MLAIYLILMAIFFTLVWVGWRFFVYVPRVKEVSEENKVNALGCATTTKKKRKAVVSILPNPPVDDFSIKTSSFERKKLIRMLLPLASLFLVLLVVGITLHFNSLHVIAPFLPKEYSQVAHIQGTFTEAKLEPPPALPPEVFISAAAIAARPGIATADRDWSKLDPHFVQVVLLVMKKMNERGYPMALLEGYRSPERQDGLATQVNVVTKAKGGQSKHQYGLAVDLAPMKDGKIIISERDKWAFEAYQALGEEAVAAGLTWGGVWSFKDYGHIEKAGSLAALMRSK